MQAPTLTQNQMKKALKKKIIKKSIRNVLSKPTTSVWPEITTDESQEIFTDMKQYLYRTPKKKILWELIKNTPKNQRKELRKQLRSNEDEKPEFMNYIVFGLNEITRGLEKNIISSILVTSDVNPQQMIRHLYYSCVNSKIPILIVPNLREEIKNTIGFSTVAIGFKNIPKNCPWFKIYKSISKLSEKFTIGQGSEENIQVKYLSENDSKQNTNNTTVNDNTDVYLYRNDINRVFRPSENESVKNSSTSKWNLDFIGINDNSTENNREASSAQTNDVEVSYTRGVPILQQLIYSERVQMQHQTKSKNKYNVLRNVNNNRKDITLKSLNKIISQVDRRINKRKKSNKKGYIPVKVKRLQSNPKRKN